VGGSSVPIVALILGLTFPKIVQLSINISQYPLTRTEVFQTFLP